MQPVHDERSEDPGCFTAGKRVRLRGGRDGTRRPVSAAGLRTSLPQARPRPQTIPVPVAQDLREVAEPSYLISSHLSPVFNTVCPSHNASATWRIYALHGCLLVIDLVTMLAHRFCILLLPFLAFFSALAKRLSGKIVPEITCFVSSGRISIYSVNQLTL